MNLNYFYDDEDNVKSVKTKHTKIKSLRNEENYKLKSTEKSRIKKLKNNIKKKDAMRYNDER